MYTICYAAVAGSSPAVPITMEVVYAFFILNMPNKLTHYEVAYFIDDEDILNKFEYDNS